MPRINFRGAQNFTISGGNFNDVAGNVTTFNFSNGLEQQLPPDAIASLVQSGNQVSSQNKKRLQDRGSTLGRSPLPNAHIQAAPSPSPSASPLVSVEDVTSPSRLRRHSHNHRSPVSISAQPPLSPDYSSPSPTDSFRSLDSGDRSDASPGSSSERSTPPTDAEEHQDVGTSGVPSSDQPQSEDLLTPLTNSLGLRRLTPSQPHETLPTIDETPTITQQPPVQVHSPAMETPAPFGLQLSRDPPHSNAVTGGPFPPGPPPRVPPRPESHASYRPPVFSPQTNPRGPPPPVPSRDSLLSPTWTNTTAPLDTPFRSVPSSSPFPPTAPTPVFSTPTQNEPSPLPAEHQELEDPAARFARLQAGRPATKGYASHLSPISQSPSNVASSSNPAPSYRNPPPTSPISPMAGAGVPSLADVTTPQNPVSPLSNAAGPQTSHWTSNSISGWVGDVHERRGRPDSPSSVEDMSGARAPTTPPEHYSQRHEEHYQHHHTQPTQPYPYDSHMDRARQEIAYNALWGQQGQQGRPLHQPPMTFNHAPPPGTFHMNPMPPPHFVLPPFGAPMFNGPQTFGNPPFGGGPFWR